MTTWPRAGDTALNARTRPSGLILRQHFQRLLRVIPLRWEKVEGQVRVGNAGRAFPAEFPGLRMPAWRFPEAPGAAGQTSLRVKARARHRVVFAAVPGKTSIVSLAPSGPCLSLDQPLLPGCSPLIGRWNPQPPDLQGQHWVRAAPPEEKEELFPEEEAGDRTHPKVPSFSFPKKRSTFPVKLGARGKQELPRY